MHGRHGMSMHEQDNRAKISEATNPLASSVMKSSDVYNSKKWRSTAMESKTYAVDFDGTISLGEWPAVGPANERLILYLLNRKRYGDKLILWTCRVGEDLDAAICFCAQQGLHFDAVNDNLPEVVERYGSNSRKITCDYYIDDRSVTVNEIMAEEVE